MWGPSVFDDALAFFKTAGWSVADVRTDVNSVGIEGFGTAYSSKVFPFTRNETSVSMRRIYTPPAEIDGAVERACSDQVADKAAQGYTDVGIRPQSLQTRTIGGHQSISCIIDSQDQAKRKFTEFYAWIYTEGLILRFSPANSGNLAVYRWAFDPVLATFKLP